MAEHLDEAAVLAAQVAYVQHTMTWDSDQRMEEALIWCN